MKNCIVIKPTIRLLLLMLFLPLMAFAQKAQVNGTVKDQSGETLIGVSVVEKGTTNGTITDLDGKYELATHNNAILEFSYIGYVSQSIEVNGRSQIDVILREDNKVLEEVVVVGYGTMKKSDVTGSVSNLNESALKQVPASNVAQSMQGRISGVQIQQTSTRPGQDSQIRVRGTRSLSASNDPLIIVDGIPFAGSMNDIAPNDIKAVDILKDASATAIYGSRGANGVILVTTNRGNYTKASVAYNGYTGFGNVSRKYKVFNAKEFLQYKSLASNTAWGLLTQEEEGKANGTDTDWQDLMYETAHIQSHDLSVSGGSETISASVGVGYYNETAVLPNQDYTRYSIRSAIDFKVTNWLKFGLNTQNSFGITNGENASNMYDILATSPLVSPYNEDGSINKQPHYPREENYNPLYVRNSKLWTQERKRFNTLNSLYAEVQFMKGLKYRMNLGLNYANDEYGDFYSSDSNFKMGGLSSAAYNTARSYNYALENLIYFDRTFNEKHTVGVTLMQSMEQSYYRFYGANVSGLVSDEELFYNLGLAQSEASINANNQKYTKQGLLSYMGRLNYSFDSRYMATVTFRSDGSSVLAKGHKWHTYPSVALAWNIKNESFMDRVNWLDMLKLRVGYGETSNQSVSPYGTLGGLSQNKYNFGDDYVYGYYISALQNPQVGWEFTKAYNAGLDWSILNGRINGSFEYYLQKTNNLLVNQRLPGSSGAAGASVLVNVGETENKGFEMNINSQNIIGKKAGDFTWETRFNLSLNRNKLVALNDGVTQDVGNGWFVGHPVDVIYDYKKIGIWQLNEADEAAKYKSVPGDIKLLDYDDNGTIDEKDRHIVGKFEPDFEFGFTNSFTYKNFDMDIVTYGQSGGTLVSTIHQPQAYLNRLDTRRNNLKVDYWTEDNPTNAFPRAGSSVSTMYNSTLGYYDASYWKIKTITLGYTIPDKLTKKWNISNLRLYVTCNNVATLFSPYMKDAGGVDPQPTGYFSQENGGGEQQSRQLTVGLNTPPARQFLFGINFKL